MKETYAVFVSVPEMYEKEKDGRKPNTLRKANPENIKKIKGATHVKIYLKGNPHNFARRITDVSEWQGWLIISWAHDEAVKR